MVKVSRYTTVEAVKLALRAPAEGDGSWTSGVFDKLLATVVDEAAVRVDDMCPGWAPFDAVVTRESRKFTPRGEHYYGLLQTTPFTVLPTSVHINGVDSRIKFQAYHGITAMRSGKGLEALGEWQWQPLTEYTFEGGSWGWEDEPPEVVLAATRIAARSFQSERNPMGTVEVDGGTMYEPRHDAAVTRWLAPYMGSELV